MNTTRPTQHDAAATYEALQAKAAGESEQLTAERVTLAERRVRYQAYQDGMGAVFWALWWLAFLAGVIGMLGFGLGWKANAHPLLVAGFVASAAVTLACLWAAVRMGTRR